MAEDVLKNYEEAETCIDYKVCGLSPLHQVVEYIELYFCEVTFSNEEMNDFMY